MEETKINIPDELVMSKIYLIRSQKVMLDRDLAELYKVPTKRLNEQVKRNLKRFPEDFMFQLNETELENWKSHFATSNSVKMGLRHKPFCFTEQGVAMLSSVLNSDTAISVNIQIIRIFTKIRQALMDNTELRLVIEKLIKKTDNNTKSIEVLFQYFHDLVKKESEPRKPVGYELPYKKTANRTKNNAD